MSGSASWAVVSFNSSPPAHPTLKYEALGPLAARGLAAYCRRHGYALCGGPAPDATLPACWSKFPAVLAALQDHDTVVWVDSDCVVIHPDRPLQDVLSEAGDWVFEHPDSLFQWLQLDVARARKQQPINTGVFAVRRSAHSLLLLQAAYAASASARPLAAGMAWSGVGDQEALTAAFNQMPALWSRVGWTCGLQTLPQDRRPEAIFMHCYGDRAEHRFESDQAQRVLERLTPQHDVLADSASARALLHWCAIQNKDRNATLSRGNPARFGHSAAVLDAAMQAFDAGRDLTCG